MITGVAFCPQAPALVPDVGRGLDVELGAVRAACRRAIRQVAVPGTRIVIVAGAEPAGTYGPTARGTLGGVGVELQIPLGADGPGPLGLPLPLTVGAWLLRDAVGPNTGALGVAVVGPGDLPSYDDAPTALIVLGDGSARRTEKAPGYLDERAAGFDARVAAAFAAGRPELLAAATLSRTTHEAHDLLAAGATAWDAVAAALAPDAETRPYAGSRPDAQVRFDAEVLYDAAPFGVGYLVAVWTARPDPGT